jgi:hypothetical protein
MVMADTYFVVAVAVAVVVEIEVEAEADKVGFETVAGNEVVVAVVAGIADDASLSVVVVDKNFDPVENSHPIEHCYSMNWKRSDSGLNLSELF